MQIDMSPEFKKKMLDFYKKMDLDATLEAIFSGIPTKKDMTQEQKPWWYDKLYRAFLSSRGSAVDEAMKDILQESTRRAKLEMAGEIENNLSLMKARPLPGNSNVSVRNKGYNEAIAFMETVITHLKNEVK